MRGPGVLPEEPGTPATKTARQRFDEVVLETVAPIDERWHKRLGLVEYAVEEAPLVPDDWGDSPVPLASVVHGRAGTPTRLVLFRRPIEHRAEDLGELRALVHTVVVEQVAEILGVDPDDVEPDRS
jgi:predicted Zn-dependent protease with MMP-like domain